jgi:hypothetical protein
MAANRRNAPPGGPSARETTIMDSRMSAVPCDTSRTGRSAVERLVNPPRKSEIP